MKFEPKNKEELMEIISKYDVVSFDIFDTLIMRKTLTPEDVFFIVQNKISNSIKGLDYVNNRRRAILENSIPNPNIYQIYDKFADLTGISAFQRQMLLELEIEVEKNTLICRDKMVEVLKETLNMGKKVYFITDMYLPTNIIADILAELGITDYNDIIVSCDYRTLKSEELFKRFKEKYPAASYLHIGDNLYSDIECAERNGLNCAVVESAICLLRRSEYCCLEERAKSITERNILGNFIAKMFNNPFCRVEKEKLKLRDMVALFISPIVYLMITDLKYNVSEGNYEKVLFASRDGYLIHKMYNLIKDDSMPEGIYFYTSRKAVTGLDLTDENKILWLANLPYSYSKDEILSKVFQVSGGKYKEGDDYNDYILQYKDEITAKSKELKSNYECYIASAGLGGGKYLFVDLVSSGTCQMYLEKLICGQIEGYYLCKLKTTEEKKEKLKYHSLFQGTENAKHKSGFYRIYYLFEAILTSFEPSLKCFDAMGQPVFENEYRTEEELKLLGQIHEDILEYVKSMFYLCDEYEPKMAEFADSMIQIFLNQDIRMNEELRLVLVDDWMNTEHLVTNVIRERGQNA